MMIAMQVSKDNFTNLLKLITKNDTSSDPEGWSASNPFWGHCAIVSLLAQDYFSGTLIRGSLERTKYANLRSHYWNKLPGGEEIDFTQEQYPDLSFEDLTGEERDRNRILKYPDTLARYILLKKRFEKLAQ